MLKNAGIWLSAAVLLVSPVLAADRVCVDQNSIDAAQDLCNPLRYLPNLAVNGVAFGLYVIVASLLTWQLIRHGGKYFMCLVIGAWCEALGLVLRIPLRNNIHSNGLYIVMYLFVVLSPCAFLAADYILLGRIVGHLDAGYYLRPLKPRFVSWVFITSDIITFLIQAAGGGLSTAKEVSTAQMGAKIFLAGIAAQMASFALFTILWAAFMIRVKTQDQHVWTRDGWRPLHFALGFTCICFMVRSVYRTIELSQGYIGYLATHEVYFFTLDTLPLFLGISVYTYFWPAKYLTEANRIVPGTTEHDLGVEGGHNGMVENGHAASTGERTLTTPTEEPKIAEKVGTIDPTRV